MVDFLREKHFAGGVRPIVSVESLGFGDIEIDVIVIHNSDSTPFYLTENYQSVMPNNIYTRVMDSNTPKNKSADLSQIEILWKKRFGLLSPPLIKNFGVFQVIRKIASMLVHMDVELQLTQVI